MAPYGPDWPRGGKWPCLSVAQPQVSGFQVDMLPSQLLDFGKPAVGEHQ